MKQKLLPLSFVGLALALFITTFNLLRSHGPNSPLNRFLASDETTESFIPYAALKVGEVPYIQFHLNDHEQIILMSQEGVEETLQRERSHHKSKKGIWLTTLGSMFFHSSIEFIRQVVVNTINRLRISPQGDQSVHQVLQGANDSLKKISGPSRILSLLSSLVDMVLQHKQNSLLKGTVKDEGAKIVKLIGDHQSKELKGESINLSMIYLNKDGEIKILNHQNRTVNDWDNFVWEDERNQLMENATSLSWAEIKHLLQHKTEEKKRNNYLAMRLLKGSGNVFHSVYPAISALIEKILFVFITPSISAFAQILMQDVVPPLAEVSLQNAIKILGLYYETFPTKNQQSESRPDIHLWPNPSF